MKSRLHIGLLPISGALLLVLALCLLLVACNGTEGLTPSDTATVYDLRVNFDGRNTAVLDAEILYFNTTGQTLDTVAFHLYPNAFSQDNPNPPYSAAEKDDFFYNGLSYGGIDVLSVEIDRTSADFDISDNGQILTVPCSLQDGEFLTASFECVLTLPECRSRFGITPDSVNLTGFYPAVCVFENGAWREDAYTAIGDPFYSETASFYATVSFPEEYVAATSGALTSALTENGVTTITAEAEGVRDFAACLSTSFTRDCADFETGGASVRVNYCFVNDDAPERTIALAADVLRTFSDTFGNYPYPELTVAQASLNAGGMEYGTMVIIDSSIDDRTDFEQTLVHEIAHQWWFGVVGSDQINTAWLDEGLTEFCTAYYYLLKGDGQTYAQAVGASENFYETYAGLPPEIGFDQSMNRPLNSFLSDGEYVAVTYMKGLLLFDALLQVAGREKFNAALAAYFADNAFGIATADDLVAAFEKQGVLAGGIIDSFVTGKVII